MFPQSTGQISSVVGQDPGLECVEAPEAEDIKGTLPPRRHPRMAHTGPDPPEAPARSAGPIWTYERTRRFGPPECWRKARAQDTAVRAYQSHPLGE